MIPSVACYWWLNYPFCSDATATGAAKIANDFELPGQHPKITPSRRSAPHLIHGSVRPKQHVDRFSRFCTAHRSVALLYNGPLRSPPQKKKNWGLGYQSNTWYIGSRDHSSHQPKRHPDRFSSAVSYGSQMLCNALPMRKKTAKITPSLWEGVILAFFNFPPPGEDRATATGNMHIELAKIAPAVREICSRTDIQTDTHTHWQTCWLQYFATARAGEVTIKTLTLVNLITHKKWLVPVVANLELGKRSAVLFPSHPLSCPPSLPLLPFPPFLQLEVGLLKSSKRSGGALQRQPKSNFVHFSCRI